MELLLQGSQCLSVHTWIGSLVWVLQVDKKLWQGVKFWARPSRFGQFLEPFMRKSRFWKSPVCSNSWILFVFLLLCAFFDGKKHASLEREICSFLVYLLSPKPSQLREEGSESDLRTGKTSPDGPVFWHPFSLILEHGVVIAKGSD